MLLILAVIMHTCLNLCSQVLSLTMPHPLPSPLPGSYTQMKKKLYLFYETCKAFSHSFIIYILVIKLCGHIFSLVLAGIYF